MKNTPIENYLSFLVNDKSKYKVYDKMVFKEYYESKKSPFWARFFLILLIFLMPISVALIKTENIEAVKIVFPIFLISIFAYFYIGLFLGDKETVIENFQQKEWEKYTKTKFRVKEGISVLFGYITSISSFPEANSKFNILDKIKGKNEEEQVKIVEEYVNKYIDEFKLGFQ